MASLVFQALIKKWQAMETAKGIGDEVHHHERSHKRGRDSLDFEGVYIDFGCIFKHFGRSKQEWIHFGGLEPANSP